MEFKVTGIVIAIASLGVAVPVEYSDGTVVKAGAGPVYKQVEYQKEVPAEYDFSYSVHDEQTGDIKSQQESRKGDVVQGRYELIDSDGHRRIVEYTVDEHSGFNAVVHREPTDIRIPQPAPQIQKIISSVPRLFTAPVTKIATPILAHHALPEKY